MAKIRTRRSSTAAESAPVAPPKVEMERDSPDEIERKEAWKLRWRKAKDALLEARAKERAEWAKAEARRKRGHQFAKAKAK